MNIVANVVMFSLSSLVIVASLSQVISAALALMTPEKANLLLLSPEHENLWDMKEKWFGAQYTTEGGPSHTHATGPMLVPSL